MQGILSRLFVHRGVTVVDQSNQKRVEALSEISDIIVQISDEDLEHMESLARQIMRFDRQLGDRILETHALLIQLHDDVESALESLEPEIEEDIEEDEEIEDDEALEIAEAELDEMDEEEDEEEDEDEERGRTRSRRRK
jgi:hypothetical protein